MTLIVAVKDGIYGDTRAIHKVGNLPIPSRAEKLRVDEDGGIAIGITGAINKDDNMYSLLMESIYSFSFYTWLCHTWSEKLAGQRSEPMLDLIHYSKAIFEQNILSFLAGSGSSGVLAITPFHTVLVDESTTLIMEDVATPLAVGSSASIALTLDRAGLTVQEIYHQAHLLDDMVDGHDVTYVPRSKLCVMRPFSFLRYTAKQALAKDPALSKETLAAVLVIAGMRAVFIREVGKNGKFKAKGLERAWEAGNQLFNHYKTMDKESLIKEL